MVARSESRAVREAEATAWWAAAEQRLDRLPDGGLNIAHVAVDRHVIGPGSDGAATALRFIDRSGDRNDLSYARLRDESSRVANVLEGLGVPRGGRVFTLLGRVPALYLTVLGSLRCGAVACPLFSAFGPEPVAQRLAKGNGVVLVTTPTLYERKVAPIRDRLSELAHVLLVEDGSGGTTVPGTLDLDELMAAAPIHHAIGPTDPEDPALLHFTSGTTGTPKGAVHVHRAVVAHLATAEVALDLHAGDVFWCTADPGWVTGTSYGIIAPLAAGATTIVDERDLDADRWYSILESEAVNVWYTAPTAIRMLERAGAEAARTHDLSALRFVASVGEPLDAGSVEWGREVLGHPIHDNWWQTETGGIMIANRAGDEVRPGSMGRPLPGTVATVLRRDDEGGILTDSDGQPVEAGIDEEGELALRPGWPSMFRGYLHDEDRYLKSFTGGAGPGHGDRWYLTGDLVRRDGDGWLWFIGRGDDIIKSSGHLIGPFEVESVLLGHPAVAEAGVIGLPDPVAGQRVKAFVVTVNGTEGDEALRRELLGFARTRLGPAVAPRDIAFRDSLPHTRSGKIMRRLLRARELGLAEGDTSALEQQ